MNGKVKRMLAIFSAILSCIVLCCLILLFSGVVNISVSGFAVDSSNRLYVGTAKQIHVYEGSRMVNSISPHTSRAYAFTIIEDENILLSTSTTVYVMDLNGNILSTADDHGADVYNQISYHKRKFVSANGDVYRLTNILGRTQILKNDSELVFQIDVLSYIVKLLLICSFVSVFVFGFWMLQVKCRK